MFKSSVIAALAGLSYGVYAQTSKLCPESSTICFKLNIPDATASSGTGDIFFQMSAPASLAWVALGQGSTMSGSQMFIMYSSANGKNVTVSPRLGDGHVQPQYNSAAEITLLSGSGIINGQMIANVKCSNCNKWKGGSMDFTASSGTWIHASCSGDPLNTDDKSVDINQHDGAHGDFGWSWKSAIGGNSANPFVVSSATGTKTGSAGASKTSCVPRPTSTSTGTPYSGRSLLGRKSSSTINYCDDDSSSDSNSDNSNDNGDLITVSSSPTTTQIMAHGVMAALAMVVFFPLGAVSLRLLSFPGMIWIHGAFQIVSYLLFTAAVGLGIYIAKGLKLTNNYHPIIGLICFVMLFFQPFLGVLHHFAFIKQGTRTGWSYAHLWLGRTVITLGIINGGLGLKLADNATSTQKIVYAVVAIVIWLAWVASAAFGEVKRRRNLPGASKSPTRGFGDDSQPADGEYYRLERRK